MAKPGDEGSAAKWKFVTSVVLWSVVAAIATVGLYPTMSTFPHAKPDLLWVGACIIALPSVVALAYGFTGNLYVGLGALAGFLASVPVYLASRGGACMAFAAILIALRGGWLLFKANRAAKPLPGAEKVPATPPSP